MDAVLFLKEWERMCKANGGCVSCEFCKEFGGDNECGLDATNHPEKAVEIVEKWSRENPVKTMMSDFFEKFPNAHKEDTGAPMVCPWTMGYCESDSEICDNLNCYDCWSRPLEESK